MVGVRILRNTSGNGIEEVINIQEGWASFDLAQGGTHTVDFYNLEYQNLIVSKDATPSFESKNCTLSCCTRIL